MHVERRYADTGLLTYLAYLGTSCSATELLLPAYTGWWAGWCVCTRAGASYPWYGIIIGTIVLSYDLYH